MRRILTGIVMSMILAPSGYASDSIVPLTLDKVTFQVSASK